jgi:hypothetical protein
MNSARDSSRDSAPDPHHTTWLHGALLVILIAGAVALLPAMQAEIWQDEAATVLEFAAHGVWHPFTTYILPNNHMLFSAALALWRNLVDSSVGLRGLPALMLVCTTVLFYACGKRVFGLAATVCALAIFYGGDLLRGFGLGLRGYPFAWPATLAMAMCAFTYLRSGAGVWMSGWWCACAWAIATVPTNAILIPVALICARFEHRVAWRTLVLRAAGACGLGCMPLLVYAPHAEKMAKLARHLSSAWSLSDLTVQWLLATCGQIWPLGVLGAVGLVMRTRGAPVPRAVIRALLWFAVYLAVVPSVLAVLPIAPYPRFSCPFCRCGVWHSVAWWRTAARAGRASRRRPVSHCWPRSASHPARPCLPAPGSSAIAAGATTSVNSIIARTITRGRCWTRWNGVCAG